MCFLHFDWHMAVVAVIVEMLHVSVVHYTHLTVLHLSVWQKSWLLFKKIVDFTKVVQSVIVCSLFSLFWFWLYHFTSPVIVVFIFFFLLSYILYFTFWWAEPGGIGPSPGWLTIVVECCGTVGWVTRPITIVPGMTYNVSRETLNPQSTRSREPEAANSVKVLNAVWVHPSVHVFISR